jgi:tetratricopeptide (TPR) repeat protein
MALVALLVPFTASAATARDSWDQAEMDSIQRENPHAAALLEKGEALGATGDVQAAYTLFRQTEAELPHASLPRRRECEALVVLGRRNEAIDACSQALAGRHTHPNIRALIRAFVDGPTPPTIAQISLALSITSTENHNSPGAPTPTAMACDIAESIGDGLMLQECAEKLERLAPFDPQTRRIVALIDSRCPPWRFWTGWLSIAAAVAVTVAHAVRRRVTRRSRLAAAALAALAFCAVAGTARAGELPRGGWLSRWPIDDAHPENSIPDEKARNSDPLEFGYWLQDLALKAERAAKAGDHAAAVRYYKALAQTVPDRAISYVKLCEEYEALGDHDRAVNSCGEALLRDGAKVRDYTRFVQLTLAKPGQISQKETAALKQVIRHMQEDPEGREASAELECEVGTRTSNAAQLRECTAALSARAPDDPKTLTYRWALAMQEGQFDVANKLLDRARSIGLSVDTMKQTTVATEKRHRLRMVLVLVAIALFLSGAGVAGRAVLRRRWTPKIA